MVRHIMFAVCAVVTFGLTAISAQETTTWQAGVAKTVITPREFIWMSGYASRTKPAEGKVHDLWAKALVLEDAQGQRCVLVTLDLIGIDRMLSDQICADLRNRHSLERSAILLSTSHTHCGPV